MPEADRSIRARFAVQRPDFSLDVDLELPAQGISALFGRSGAGKTTLLRCIAGLEPAIAGHFSIGDRVYQHDEQDDFQDTHGFRGFRDTHRTRFQDTHRSGKFQDTHQSKFQNTHRSVPNIRDIHRIVPAHRRRFGYVFQQPSLFQHLSIRDNLRFGARRARDVANPLTLDRISELLALGPLLHRSPQSLSGGQQQRVAIGRALLSQPRLLLLDEPLAGLDLESRDEILPHLEALHRELSMPIIYVSHVPMEVQRLADYLVLLEQGAVVASGDINDLLTRPGLALSQVEEAGALLSATVQGHIPDHHLTELSVPGGKIFVSAQNLDVGAPVRLRILARDVSIALQRYDDTSISNVLPATIVSINDDRDPANCLLQLEVGRAVVLSRITRRSVERLRLRVGLAVFAQIKSVALM